MENSLIKYCDLLTSFSMLTKFVWIFVTFYILEQKVQNFHFKQIDIIYAFYKKRYIIFTHILETALYF